jgi:2-oxoglutarate ferredoxin oxidoreductase subunit gamma
MRRKLERDPVQIRLSGTGGQGMITAGVILAEAALLDRKNVVQTQSYGPEARLGASRSEVIISSRKIAYPEVTKPDILLCMSQDAFRKYAPQVSSHTIILLDSTNVDLPPDFRKEGLAVYALPITETARKLGRRVVANVVALGAMNALLGLVSPESLREAVVRRVPERFREMNVQALEAGEELAQAHGEAALTHTDRGRERSCRDTGTKKRP